MTFLLICICGGVGAVARFVLNTSIQRWWKNAFPLSTFIINVIATFCAGLAASALAHQAVGEPTYLLFVTGFLGGFSTFSTAINEMVSLVRGHKYAVASLYLLATVVVPLICVALGWAVGAMAH
ncbi:fluoride efflux transporter FluC [Bifidobacterium oedipodis]|uniref:Fluoride-specific ion channel FluC n=1 Tax=Bifidobacterium oedipodis TaxID=2675322 RepID=A0A7Y0EN61_9BIFI|nr:CrcB family protein [Bifidobacterium sp. DSM 109957]NMM93350.1 camphor resistance protein CrcB [Bifidobacterium sp. DSM 109957]